MNLQFYELRFLGIQSILITSSKQKIQTQEEPSGDISAIVNVYPPPTPHLLTFCSLPE